MYRKIRTARSPAKTTPQAVAVVLFDRKSKRLPEGYRTLDRRCGGALSAALRRTEFSRARGAVNCIYPQKGAERLYVMGLGAPQNFEPSHVRLIGAALLRAAWPARLGRLKIQLRAGIDKVDLQAAGRALGEGMAIANFNFDDFKGTADQGRSAAPTTTKDLAVEVESELRRSYDRGVKVGVSVNVARTLAATPPNVANPAYLVTTCRRMSKRLGLRCRVIDHKAAKRLGMGGLTAVGQAGSTPPALICMEHRPTSRRRKGPVLLVGKAITFDTGGYSLKINNSMLGMKYDKCGGMAVIGAMHAVASLKLPIHVVGLVAAAENMVDTAAYRPNDILKMVNGVSVEVTNTDAEGRLVLADALAYGCHNYKPVGVIDLATLTGGIVAALGASCAGLFCDDSRLRTSLMEAGERSGDRLWPMPLWDEHRNLIKGTHSDLVNSGAARGAYAIQGAAFLSYFATPDGDPKKIGKLPWAHIDIAGVADVREESALFAKGPTGYGVKLLATALESWPS